MFRLTTTNNGWTDAQIGAATRILNKNVSVGAAIAQLESLLGRAISDNALRKAFQSRGLGCPSSYLTTADIVDHGTQTATFSSYSARGGRSLETALVLPDLHAPYHDKRAFDLVLKVGRMLRPDRIITMGDFADFYAVSSHSKDPSRTANLADELKVVNECLDALDTLGATNKHFIEGNHENRLTRYLTDKAPALFDTVRTKDLLHLADRGWSWTPYRSHLKVGKMYFTHDTGSAGANAHIKAGNQFEASVMIGHVHRLVASYFGNIEGQHHVAAACGWLGDASQIDYMYSANIKDWQLGFATLFIEPSGTVHVGLVPIIDYSCVVMGQLVSV